jgi:hypothetical protein
MRTGCCGEYVDPTRDEETGGWTKLQNAWLHNMYPRQPLLPDHRIKGDASGTQQMKHRV